MGRVKRSGVGGGEREEKRESIFFSPPPPPPPFSFFHPSTYPNRVTIFTLPNLPSVITSKMVVITVRT